MLFTVKRIVPGIHHTLGYTSFLWRFRFSSYSVIVINVETFSIIFMQVLHGFSFCLLVCFFKNDVGERGWEGEASVIYFFLNSVRSCFGLGGWEIPHCAWPAIVCLPANIQPRENSCLKQWKASKFLLETMGRFNFIFALKGSLWLKPVWGTT